MSSVYSTPDRPSRDTGPGRSSIKRPRSSAKKLLKSLLKGSKAALSPKRNSASSSTSSTTVSFHHTTLTTVVSEETSLPPPADSRDDCEVEDEDSAGSLPSSEMWKTFRGRRSPSKSERQTESPVEPSENNNVVDFQLPESAGGSPSSKTPAKRQVFSQPGTAIPTPYVSSQPAFPHPLPNTQNETEDEFHSPISDPKASISDRFEKEDENGFLRRVDDADNHHDEDDDEAFFPDDFKERLSVSPRPKGATQSYSWEQVQLFIDEAKDKLRVELEDQHEAAMEEYQRQAEENLQRHGEQWQIESQAEYDRLEALLKGEQNKSQQKHHELINLTTQRNELKSQLEQTKNDLHTAKGEDDRDSKIMELQAELEKLKEEQKAAHDEGALSKLRNMPNNTNLVDKQELNDAQQAVKDMEVVVANQHEELSALRQQLEAFTRLEASASAPTSSEEVEALQSQLQDTIAAKTKELAELEAELESTRDSHLTEMESLNSKLIASEQMVEQLTQQSKDNESEMADMRKILEEEKNQMTQHHEAEVALLQAKINDLELTAQEKEVVAEELRQVTTAMAEMKSLHDQEMAQASELDTEALKEVQSQLDKERAARMALEDEVSKTKDALGAKVIELDQVKSSFDNESSHLKNLEKEMESKTKSLQDLQEQLEAANVRMSESEDRAQELEDSIQQLKRRHSEEIASAQEEAKSQMATELEELERKVSELLADGGSQTNTIDELTRKIEEEKEDYERRLQQQKSEYNKEVDELLKQLDLVEADNRTKLAQVAKEVDAKAAVITELGAELEKSQSRQLSMSKESELTSSELSETKRHLLTTTKELQDLKSEIMKLEAMHDVHIREVLAEKDREMEDAKKDIIERITEEYSEFKHKYSELNQEYNKALQVIDRLQAEIDAKEHAVAQERRKGESRALAIEEQLAEVRAEMATMEADHARKHKNHIHELEQLKKAVFEAQSRLEKEKASNQGLQTHMANLVKDKEALKREFDELNIVSQELVAELEARDSRKI